MSEFQLGTHFNSSASNFGLQPPGPVILASLITVLVYSSPHFILEGSTLLSKFLSQVYKFALSRNISIKPESKKLRLQQSESSKL